MTNDDRCPTCGEELTFDEVDIGVGVQRGNPRCDNCGWPAPCECGCGRLGRMEFLHPEDYRGERG